MPAVHAFAEDELPPPLPADSPRRTPFVTLVEEVGPSTIDIHALRREKGKPVGMFNGSGTVIHEDGWILTCNHTAFDEKDGKATVEVDGRPFGCMYHEREVGMPMWMCNEAYFGSFDLIELARHFADYGYMFDDPNRIVCDNAGDVVKPPTKKTTTKKTAKKTTARRGS